MTLQPDSHSVIAADCHHASTPLVEGWYLALVAACVIGPALWKRSSLRIGGFSLLAFS
jgi:hypothetical protein